MRPRKSTCLSREDRTRGTSLKYPIEGEYMASTRNNSSRSVLPNEYAWSAINGLVYSINAKVYNVAELLLKLI